MGWVQGHRGRTSWGHSLGDGWCDGFRSSKASVQNLPCSHSAQEGRMHKHTVTLESYHTRATITSKRRFEITPVGVSRRGGAWHSEARRRRTLSILGAKTEQPSAYNSPLLHLRNLISCLPTITDPPPQTSLCSKHRPTTSKRGVWRMVETPRKWRMV